MKIETDTKLDFNNVLIRPKRSTINSRSQVDITRGFRFPNIIERENDLIYAEEPEGVRGWINNQNILNKLGSIILNHPDAHKNTITSPFSLGIKVGLLPPNHISKSPPS